MSNREPIVKFEANAIKSKTKDVIITTLLNEHNRADALASRLKDIYNGIDKASSLGKTQPPSADEQPNDAKARLSATLKGVLDKLKEIDINELSHMTANTSLNGVQIVEESKTEQISESSQALIKSYKLDPNTKTFSGNPGEKLAP